MHRSFVLVVTAIVMVIALLLPGGASGATGGVVHYSVSWNELNPANLVAPHYTWQHTATGFVTCDAAVGAGGTCAGVDTAGALAAQAEAVAPRPGYEYVWVHVTEWTAGTGNFLSDPNHFRIQSDGDVYRMIASPPPGVAGRDAMQPYDMLVSPGESNSGWIQFEIGASDSGLSLQWNDQQNGGWVPFASFRVVTQIVSPAPVATNAPDSAATATAVAGAATSATASAQQWATATARLTATATGRPISFDTPSLRIASASGGPLPAGLRPGARICVCGRVYVASAPTGAAVVAVVRRYFRARAQGAWKLHSHTLPLISVHPPDGSGVYPLQFVTTLGAEGVYRFRLDVTVRSATLTLRRMSGRTAGLTVSIR